MDITITLSEDEIKEAVTSHLKKSNVPTLGKDMDFTFTQGRGSNGASAVVCLKGNALIEEKELAAAEPKKVTPVADKPKKVAKSLVDDQVETLFAAAAEPDPQPVKEEAVEETKADEEMESLFQV